MKQEFFFIFGCQRSGTTLTRLILDSHSEIHCFDEFKSYELLANKHLLDNELSKYQNTKLVGFKPLGYTEQMNEPYLHEPVNNFVIKNEYTESKMIFLYRDPRDVISSMKNYIQKNGKSWLDNWIFHTIDFWKKKLPNFEKKFQNELSLIENSSDKIISSAALYWKVKTQSLFEYEQQNRKIHKVKYEELVTSPKNEIAKIAKFLNISWNNNLLLHHKIVHDEVNSDGFTVGKTDTSRPIETKSIGTFVKNLTDFEQKEIITIASDLMTKLNYS